MYVKNAVLQFRHSVGETDGKIAFRLKKVRFFDSPVKLRIYTFVSIKSTFETFPVNNRVHWKERVIIGIEKLLNISFPIGKTHLKDQK